PAVEEVVVVEEVTPVAAAPALTVTNFGQFVAVENTSGNENIGEAVHFGNVIGLAYDDWTFDLMARKTWSIDTDNGTHSNGHRIDMDLLKNYEHFSVGARWRQEADKDKYLAKFKYSYGMFSGWVDAGYQSNNTEDVNDAWYSEGIPVAVTVGPLTVGYYYEWDKTINPKIEETNEFGYKGSLTQQVRAWAPVYTGEKLSLGVEYRYQFDEDKDYKDSKKGWQENNRHIAILNANYALTENLSVNGYYEYDWNKFENHVDDHQEKHGKYYGEFGLGWNYAF
ncbi:MtrB/PioB family outer membrane beta-barrel protein, partial [Fusobacterium sp.]|uniref:MtrB/PioB family outer membrane beta-barrel protein n=1 Tax=Fusobacterium sp. TaxID=68766 RepID=UPI002613E974